MSSRQIPKNDTPPIDQETDLFKIKAIDHVEFWVGNAKQSTFFWKVLGFKPVARSGLETANRRFASWVLEQGRIRFVLSTSYSPHDEMSVHNLIHGDGVKVIAMEVEDVEQAWRETTSRGAKGLQPPTEYKDEFGLLYTARIATYGQTVHEFVDRSNYKGAFKPGYAVLPEDRGAKQVGLKEIDHIVGNVELGKMNYWVNWYHEVMGFRQIVHYDDKVIHTEYSALMSKVMGNGDERIKFPINEPAQGKRKSQIEEYLDYYIGAGVQHIAMLTDDIVGTVRELRDRGIEFLRVPQAYYDLLPERVGILQERFEDINEQGILVDRDDEGYLLQIFTKPIQDRPTVFLEVIQRRGARGFGVGNFRALFESIEIEQAKRGNL
ncbi:MAG: 4-hydroxyphenylpyruvate dioxygenase [Candidatus Tectomicrobia bacterium]|uniref:4-hydroxyphenylpyruvate dioxygenase n=1 Tax=Tectimicrobiota bacterium TaxID=2528274 RepID=A0A933GMD3_UNCTE|nr:4-hydroxyphenylpyruvate dioxygenase [Candidatus Tectomicrobia bacterium]